ncbi:DbpA RNA binding domain-containing protein [Dankookia sp. P2]|uniref:DbpA RNA binding domain-containing protein n=1 Tax=Dankookia sp. P2 TaxID=3423955 RepID=UPI003D67A2FC
MTDRGPAGPRVPRESGPQQEGVWFRMNLGRANGNADPRWVLPFLCRRGHVTRQEIGRIKVQDRETQFEVAPWVAERFAAAAQRPGDEEDAHIRIFPLQGGAVIRIAAAPPAGARPAAGAGADPPPRGALTEQGWCRGRVCA